MEFTNLLMRFSEIVGTVAFAISGAMVAVRYRLDLFGVLLLGGVTALGGGTLRDLLMGSVPPRMFSSFEYLLIAAITSFVVFTLAYFARGKEWKRPSALGEMLNVIDALGLGAFAVAGTQMPMLGGYADNPFMCVFLGMTTGVGGGILRDLMIRDIPAVLRKDVYARGGHYRKRCVLSAGPVHGRKFRRAYPGWHRGNGGHSRAGFPLSLESAPDQIPPGSVLADTENPAVTISKMDYESLKNAI